LSLFRVSSLLPSVIPAPSRDPEFLQKGWIPHQVRDDDSFDFVSFVSLTVCLKRPLAPTLPLQKMSGFATSSDE